MKYGKTQRHIKNLYKTRGKYRKQLENSKNSIKRKRAEDGEYVFAKTRIKNLKKAETLKAKKLKKTE